MQSSIRLSSLHVRCSHVEFASSANQVRYHTKNRYSLTLNVSSRLTNHERDDIHENIIACIITYLAKFPRLSVLIKKSLLKKNYQMNENDCCLCKDGRDTIPSLLLQDNRDATPIPRTIFRFPREFESVFPENACGS